jgi:hypothetical protein
MRESSARFVFPLLLVILVFGCRSSAPSVPRYIVTAAPVDAVGGGWTVCIAVDPTDAHGVWWWQPGPSGCDSRITDPTVFRGDRAQVKATSTSSSISASFTLQYHFGSRAINLVLQDSEMRFADSGIRVPTQRRVDLDIQPAFRR